jgi:hypothetical protein
MRERDNNFVFILEYGREDSFNEGTGRLNKLQTKNLNKTNHSLVLKFGECSHQGRKMEI